MSSATKNTLYEQIARVAKALAAPGRLALVDLLGQAPRTVEAVAALTGMSIANTSQHLQVLRAAGLVEPERKGTYVTYRLASNEVAELFVRLRLLSEDRLAEVARLKSEFFESDDDLDELSAKELAQRVQRGSVVLLDVRPAEEFETAHIAGAISIPHDELVKRLDELPKNKPVVAYCRGPYCVFAHEAVRLLKKRGFKASRIESGVAEWRLRKLAVESGTGAGR
jgi:rhodanese-related sulfurtransferase/DNA-binding transcriptional ArsR family regulator